MSDFARNLTRSAKTGLERRRVHLKFGSFFVIAPDKSRAQYEIPSAAIAIGQSPACALTLPHDGVATTHARFEWRDGVPTIVSVDGSVSVNQNTVREQALHQGDVIKVGHCYLVYHAPTPGASAAVALDAIPSKPPSAEGRQRPSPLSPTPTHLPSVVSGSVKQRQLSTNEIVHIGRDPSNQIVLNSLQASRFHAEVVAQGKTYFIRDLGSTNGTFVNGQRVPPHAPVALARGTTIKISDYTFYFDGQRIEHFSEAGNARIDAMNLRRVLANGQILLHDVSLSILPREFVAVVGGSGAGKSTLVNALSGFRPADSGTVLLNGHDYYSHLEAFRSTLGYVPQDDIIHTELTPYRALHYAALLRMPEDVSAQEREGRIHEVLHELHLAERKDVSIGRLSGGQRKRVSIGVELLTRPRLFYLDEPTSGLDPGMEHEMMKIFRQLADRGHTLILITHATTNIMLCDKIAFLAHGGYLAFYGPPAKALEYFGARDFTEIYTKVDNEKSPQQWDTEFARSPYHHKYVATRLREVKALVEHGAGSTAEPLAGARSRHGSRGRQFRILVRRYLDIVSRDRANLAILLAQAPLLALILLVLVLGKQTLFVERTFDNFGNVKIVLFLLTLFSLMCGTINSVREIVKESPIYRRERAVNLRIAPYLLSKFLVLAAVSALQSAVFVGVVFAYLQRPDTEYFLLYAFVALFMVNLAGVAIGLAVSASVPNQNIAITLLPVVLLAQIVLSGILARLDGDMTRWLPRLTAMRWGFGMLGHLVHATSWPMAPGVIAPAEVWDIPLGPNDDGAGGVVALSIYVAVALLFAHMMLAERDKRAD